MEGFVATLVYSFFTFAGALIFGHLPLLFRLSQKSLRIVSIFGVGLIVGTALAVIIPEGIHAIYVIHKDADNNLVVLTTSEDLLEGIDVLHGHRGVVLNNEQDSFGVESQVDERNESDGKEQSSNQKLHPHSSDLPSKASHNELESNSDYSSHHRHSKEEEEESRKGAFIGIALVTGFVLQLIVDHVLSSGNGHGHMHSFPSHDLNGDINSKMFQRSSYSSKKEGVELTSIHKSIPLKEVVSNGLENNSSVCISEKIDVKGTAEVNSSKERQRNIPGENRPSKSKHCSSITAMQHNTAVPFSYQSLAPSVGLLIHSLVDGVALGAATFSNNSAMELVVFLAIILHKAPASFGLTSFLLHVGKPINQIKVIIFGFSLAAPLGAILTFSILKNGFIDQGDTKDFMGYLLLFSGGSFLYVATVHMLPELREKQPLDIRGVFILVIGIIFPLILSSLQEHHH